MDDSGTATEAPMFPPFLKAALVFVGLAALFVLMQTGWVLATPPGGGPPWAYAATGLLVGCLHLMGRQVWPYILAAYVAAGVFVWWQFSGGAMNGGALEPRGLLSLAAIAVDIAEAMIVLYVIERINPEADPFKDLSSSLVLIAACLAMAGLGLFMGLLSLLEADLTQVDLNAFMTVWSDWARAHVTGLLLVGGFFLSWFGMRPSWAVRTIRQRAWEMLAAALLLGALVFAIFNTESPYLSGAVALAVPVIVWLTIRFSVEGGLLAVLLLAQSLLTSAALHSGDWYGAIDVDERRLFQITISALAASVILLGGQKRGDFKKAVRKRDRKRLYRS